MKFTEILLISLQSLKTNRLRTFLTILGVVVGIFSIIVVMTIITMLQKSIEGGLSQLNQNTFQIQKFPAMQTGGPGSRDKYRNRKDITYEEFLRLESMLTSAKYIGAENWQWGQIVKYGNKETNPNVQVAGISADAMFTNDWIINEGRDIRNNDIMYSSWVCVLGQDVADMIFDYQNPIGKTVRIGGNPLTVIGVLERKASLFGQSRDNHVLIPITTYQSIYGKTGRSLNITVMAKDKESYDATIEHAIGYLRTIRGVKAGEENDFEIWSNESLIGEMNNITSGVRIGALVISIISLLAAGIGIMNIMLVSVTERTKEIGIRKAIGARKNVILFQFLMEAVILCLLGGIIGVVIGVGIGNFAGSFLNAQAAIPIDWVLIGISLCIFVGVLFGTYPAYKASNLDPIEALRYE